MNTQATETKPTAAATVTVGCHLPNGMLLEMGKPGSEDYRRVVVKGANASLIQTAGGFGITEVDANFWTAWHKKYSWLPAVKGKHIFAVGDQASAQAAAIEFSNEKTGLEPLDPNVLPAKADPEKQGELSVDAEHLQRVRQSGNRFGGIGARG